MIHGKRPCCKVALTGQEPCSAFVLERRQTASPKVGNIAMLIHESTAEKTGNK